MVSMTQHLMRLSCLKAFRKPFEIDSADARNLAEIKRRRTCCTLSIYFGVVTTQMYCIFQKVG